MATATLYFSERDQVDVRGIDGIDPWMTVGEVRMVPLTHGIADRLADGFRELAGRQRGDAKEEGTEEGARLARLHEAAPALRDFAELVLRSIEDGSIRARAMHDRLAQEARELLALAGEADQSEPEAAGDNASTDTGPSGAGSEHLAGSDAASDDVRTVVP